MGSARRGRAVLALAVNNWLSRCYLAAVALCTAYTLWEDIFLKEADASMTFVLPLLLTAPLNIPVSIALHWIPTDLPFYVGLAFGALVNAVVLGTLARALHRRWLSSAGPASTP